MIDLINYRLIRSKRKTISIHIDDNCEIVVRAPVKMPKNEIDEMVKGQSQWIEKHMPDARKRMQEAEKITPELIRNLKEKAKTVIPPIVEMYSEKMEVKPTAIKITSARKRFGSCSGKNSLCFSCFLMLYPMQAIECVVVHELAHIRHHDHSQSFYAFVYSVMPDYRSRELLLRDTPAIE